MPNSLKRGYPYPDANMAPDVPLRIQQLAEALDTDVDAINSRLLTQERALQYAEFLGDTALSSGTLWGAGPLSKDPAQVQNDAAITSPGNDQVHLPVGVWLVHVKVRLVTDDANRTDKNAVGQTYGSLRKTPAGGTFAEEYDSFEINSGPTGSLIVPIRITAAGGGDMYFRFYSAGTTGARILTRIKVSEVR